MFCSSACMSRSQDAGKGFGCHHLHKDTATEEDAGNLAVVGKDFGVKSGFFLGLARLLHSLGCLVICCPHNKRERG